jgi:hypothetical protein
VRCGGLWCGVGLAGRRSVTSPPRSCGLRRWVKVVCCGSAFGLCGHRTGVARMPTSRIASSVQRSGAVNAALRALSRECGGTVPRRRRRIESARQRHGARAYRGFDDAEQELGLSAAGTDARARWPVCGRRPSAAGPTSSRPDLGAPGGPVPGRTTAANRPTLPEARADDRPRNEVPTPLALFADDRSRRAVGRRLRWAPGRARSELLVWPKGADNIGHTNNSTILSDPRIRLCLHPHKTPPRR